MKTFRALQAVAVAVLAFAGCSREREEYYNGRGNATADASKGTLHIAYADGAERPPWAVLYDQLLQTNFGVTPTFFSLPSNPRAAEAWARGYNEVAEPEIDRKFGSNALARMKTDAQSRYEKTPKKSNP